MFKDRYQAGRHLAERLATLPKADVVIGLARGGMVVARAIAESLAIPCDVLVVKKIPSPINPELALGAIAPDGVAILHDESIAGLEVDENYMKSQIAHLNVLIMRKTQLYRKGRERLRISGKRVILADDGMATGATMQAAVAWCREQMPDGKHPAEDTEGKQRSRTTAGIIVAVPVAAIDAVEIIRPLVDDMVILEAPNNFDSVGRYYEYFEQVEDEEVVQLLAQS